MKHARGLLVSAVLLVSMTGCSWLGLSDAHAPPPYECGPSSCPGMQCFRGGCEPFEGAIARDAGTD